MVQLKWKLHYLRTVNNIVPRKIASQYAVFAELLLKWHNIQELDCYAIATIISLYSNTTLHFFSNRVYTRFDDLIHPYFYALLKNKLKKKKSPKIFPGLVCLC